MPLNALSLLVSPSVREFAPDIPSVNDESFYEKYLVNFLQSGADRDHYVGPTVNSLWVVEIETTADELLAISKMGANVGNWTSSHVLSTKLFADTAAIAAKYVQPASVNGFRPIYVVQSIGVPGESNTISYPETVKYGSGLEGANVGKRGQMNEVSMNFLLTDYSFVDLILRPWSIAISHYGAKLRGLRKNITCVLFTRREGEWAVGTLKTQAGVTQWRARQKFVFHGAYPVNVGSTEFNYKGSDIDKTTTVKFVHDYYSIEALVSPSTYTRGSSTDDKVRKTMAEAIYPDRGDLFTMDRPIFFTGVPLEGYKPVAVTPGFIRQAANMVAKASQTATQYLGAATMSKLGLGKANTIINLGKRMLNTEDQDASLNTTSRMYKGQSGHGYVWRSDGGPVAIGQEPGLLSKTLSKIKGEGDRTIHTHILDEALALAARALEKSLGATNFDASRGGAAASTAIRGNDTPGLDSVRLTRINGSDTVMYPIPKTNSVNINENDMSVGAMVSTVKRTFVQPDTPININTTADIIKINETDRPLAVQLMINGVPVDKNDVSNSQKTRFSKVNGSGEDESAGGAKISSVRVGRDDAGNGSAVASKDIQINQADESVGRSVRISTIVASGNDASVGRLTAGKTIAINENDAVFGRSIARKSVSINENDATVGLDSRGAMVVVNDNDVANGYSARPRVISQPGKDAPNTSAIRIKQVSTQENDHTDSRRIRPVDVAISTGDSAGGSVRTRHVIRVNLDDSIDGNRNSGFTVPIRTGSVPNAAKNSAHTITDIRRDTSKMESADYKRVTPSHVDGGGTNYRRVDPGARDTDNTSVHALSQYKEVVTKHTQAILDRAKERANGRGR